MEVRAGWVLAMGELGGGGEGAEPLPLGAPTAPIPAEAAASRGLTWISFFFLSFWPLFCAVCERGCL